VGQLGGRGSFVASEVRRRGGGEDPVALRPPAFAGCPLSLVIAVPPTLRAGTAVVKEQWPGDPQRTSTGRFGCG
jgi:hypothetical protein